jgi:predicted nucleic acid-binding protein
MVTAVDSSVLLDVLVNSPDAARSERALQDASAQGSLIVCECVIAEIRPAISEAKMMEVLTDWKLRFVPSSLESALRAGEIYAEYLRRKGRAPRVVPDFLIGAHAVYHADRLLARDRGYLRSYFRGLTVLEP